MGGRFLGLGRFTVCVIIILVLLLVIGQYSLSISNPVVIHFGACHGVKTLRTQDTSDPRHFGRSPFSHLSHPNRNPNSYPNITLTLNLTLA